MPQEAYTRGQWRERLAPRVETGWLVYGELHPDTDPDAIAEAQREAIRPHAGRTVAKISDLVILPASVVRRRLVEMGLTPKE